MLNAEVMHLKRTLQTFYRRFYWPFAKDQDIEERLEKLTNKVDKAAWKTQEDLATFEQGSLVQG